MNISLKLFSKATVLNLPKISVTFEVATSTVRIILNFVITNYLFSSTTVELRMYA